MTVSANKRRGAWLETATIVIEALAIAMLVRTFLYQPFNIPSGSMKETLLDRRLPLRLQALLWLQPLFVLQPDPVRTAASSPPSPSAATSSSSSCRATIPPTTSSA